MTKKFFAFFTVLLIFSVTLSADVYVKIKEHRDGYYDGGTVVPDEDSITEQWIGEDKVAVTGDGLHYICDLGKGQMILINPNKKFYSETPLPLDLSKLLDEQYYERARMFQFKGTARKTDETKKIGKWDCRKVEVETWIEFQGGRFYETVREDWVTQDVPFDLGKYEKIRNDFYVLNNYGEELVNILKNISGYQILSESTTYERGEERKSSREVLEMTEKDPPEGIYAIPEGVTKKEKLTREDFS